MERLAGYRRFPPFSSWPTRVEREWLWRRRVAELEAARSRATLDERALAAELTVRAAGIDRGATEALRPAPGALMQDTLVDVLEDKLSAIFEAHRRTCDVVARVVAADVAVDEALILRLHKEALAPNDPGNPVLTPGEYRRWPNFLVWPDGKRRAGAPVELVAPEIERFVRELHAPAFARAHPVRQASYASYSLFVIHPFAEGNGRVGRALASIYLRRAAGSLLHVFVDQRADYDDALQAANAGDYLPFVRFVFAGGLAAMTLELEAFRAAASLCART